METSAVVCPAVDVVGAASCLVVSSVLDVTRMRAVDLESVVNAVVLGCDVTIVVRAAVCVNCLLRGVVTGALVTIVLSRLVDVTGIRATVDVKARVGGLVVLSVERNLVVICVVRIL